MTSMACKIWVITSIVEYQIQWCRQVGGFLREHGNCIVVSFMIASSVVSIETVQTPPSGYLNQYSSIRHQDEAQYL